MRVLVAPDKFKGSLSAAEVARCLVLGLSASGAECRALPLAERGPRGRGGRRPPREKWRAGTHGGGAPPAPPGRQCYR
ncbi:glycerate kinase [Nocardia brasiliensis]|uniref:glycerate kinase n=1 Tax=Nocardia brasiliensis TaxID=37326 RepID=UPI0024550DB6|nr:glycerate kinase [Nocardia brasiliensis]